MPLLDAIRAAMAEVEGFRGIRLGAVCDVVVSVELADDLRLLLAELLENATVASPPDAVVEVGAALGETCRVVVVDHGIGMPADRLAEENQRLRERQRLDLAPSSVLGLFVVGRLARRHGLTVDLSPTAGHGVTVTVDIPPRLYTPATVAAAIEAAPAPPAVAPLAGVGVAPGYPGNGWPRDQQVRVVPLSIPAAADNPRFSWFPAEAGSATTPSWNRPTVPERRVPVPDTANAPQAWDRSVEPGPARRGGLNRRVPGQHAAGLLAGVPAAAPAIRDALAERAQMEGFAQAGVLAAQGPTEPRQPERPGPPQRDGLTRRTPGAHVNAAVRTGGPAALPPRDPAAEREQMAGFLDGFARGAHRPPTTEPPARRGSR
jgi:hypothetical protein